MTKIHPAHPAVSLRDEMLDAGWSVSDFAARLGVSRNTASRLLNGRCGISPALAVALERIGWSNARFWMRRQAYYDLDKHLVAMGECESTPHPTTGQTAEAEGQ